MSVLNFNVLRRWWDNIVLKNYVEGGTPAVLGPLTVTENGTYDPEDDDLDGYSSVTVNVPSAELGTKSITANGTYAASSDNLDGYSSVTVNVAVGVDLNGIADGTLPSGNITLETATKIRNGAFRNCGNLTAIHAVAVTDIDSNIIDGSPVEIFVNEGHVTGNHSSRFTRATSLQKVDYDNEYISIYEFQHDAALTTVINRHSTVATLQNSAAFSNTPFDSSGSGGNMYVPSALISSYEGATNWSTLYAAETMNFVAIEGSQYETKYADGTNI